MDLRRTLEISKSTGMRGLAGRYGPLGEFHKRRKLSAGKWRYMGHLITKDSSSGLWKSTPGIYFVVLSNNEVALHKRDIIRRKSKDAIVWLLYKRYIALAYAVIDIENERRKDTR